MGAKICVGIEKFPDGMYNKAMLLTMDNGTQVVAKVPNPNAGKPHFTTASEVATMDFVSFNVCLMNDNLSTLISCRRAMSFKLQYQKCSLEVPRPEKILSVQSILSWRRFKVLSLNGSGQV